MTREMKLEILRTRYNTLRARKDKNLKSPGVLRKLAREIRNMEKE